MTEDYLDQLLKIAAEINRLADLEHLVDKKDWKSTKEEYDTLEGKFIEIRDRYVDELLSTTDGREHALSAVAETIADIRSSCDKSWIPAIDYVSDKLLPYLEKEAARDPRIRKAIKAMPLVFSVMALIAYFAIRSLSATPTSHGIESKEGIQERAAALHKVLRYDRWMDTHVRKGGWIKGILFWPIEPAEKEIKGASEFAALAYEAQQIAVERLKCPAIVRGYQNKPSKEELNYLSEAASYLRNANTQWKDPALFTVVDAARAAGAC